MAKDRQIITSNRNILGAKMAVVEGIAHVLKDRLCSGQDITPEAVTILVEAVKSAADTAEVLETDLGARL